MTDIDREKVIKSLETCSDVFYGCKGACSSCAYSQMEKCFGELVYNAITLLKEQEEQKRKWLQNIADNQLSIGGVDPLTEYEQGKWDGLQMAFEILTEER